MFNRDVGRDGNSNEEAVCTKPLLLGVVPEIAKA